MTISDLLEALSRYRRAHDDQLPPEPLHFTIAQWNAFNPISQHAIQFGDPAGGRPQTIAGLRVEVHRELSGSGAPHDSCPELWTETPKPSRGFSLPDFATGRRV